MLSCGQLSESKGARGKSVRQICARLGTIAAPPPKLLPRKRRTELLKCFREMDGRLTLD